jgi:cytochrome b
LGAISVVLMLGLVLTVVVMGLFAVDVDGLYSGPLSAEVSFKLGRRLARLHHQWFNYLQWVIGLHLAAVVFYFAWKRENLIRAMITGKRRGPGAVQMQHAPWSRFIIGAVIVAAIVYAISANFWYFWLYF